ncbi:MAG: hypothetical protein AABY51_03915 [Deltaproteobacteria bacterium]
MKEKNALIRLFLISFLTLFAEMVFIRYLSSNIYLLSYYKNAVLIAAFLGLGAGMMMDKGRASLLRLLPVATLAFICIVVYFNDYLRIDLDYAGLDESIWPEFWANSRAQSVPIFMVLSFFYIVVALYFVPLGQETIKAMSSFRPLAAYSVNLAGSILGVIAFSIAGWLWTTPVVWFTVFLVPLLWLTRSGSSAITFVINAASVVLTIFVVFSSVLGPEMWSPYSKVRVYPFAGGFDSGFISTTNGNPQVGAMNFDLKYSGPEAALNNESKSIYMIPYFALSPKRVMVVGAGAGNEVAMALRNGATSVDAVEIDPAFVAIGSVMSPHRPFTDKRVSVHIDDARAYFHKAVPGYDLIVIGFLDSQYHLSQMSNIRTENFVYTYESLRRTKDLLSENGILQLNYNAPRLDMRAKLYYMLRDIYGGDLRVYAPARPVSGNISFVAGPGVRAIPADLPDLTTGVFTTQVDKKNYPTDDWPFLYIESKKIPSEYISMLIFIPLASIGVIRVVCGGFSGFSLRFFMLGVGFMLLETKSITSFALLFGSTGTVVSLVFCSILIAGLLANLTVHLFSIRSVKLPYALLFATIAGLYFLPLEMFMDLSWWSRLAVAAGLIGAPLFFAAIIFGVSFAQSSRMNTDFGSNIIGAVVGGMSEYLSMAFGFKALYIIALSAYFIAFLAHSRGSGR